MVLHSLYEKLELFQDWVIETYFIPYAESVSYFAFAFVFFYFGVQKPSPWQTPVTQNVNLFVSNFGLSVETAIIFIGFFEMVLGLLFLFKQIRLAFWLFIPHQLTTLLVLTVIPFSIFQPPWVFIFGLRIPVALGSFSAFIFKNVIFIGGFMLLAANEHNSQTETNEE